MYTVNTTGDLEGRCNQKMRGGFCAHDAGHRGRHASVTWRCDGCGKTQRSAPFATDPEVGAFCFMCASEQVQNPHGLPGYEGW